MKLVTYEPKAFVDRFFDTDPFFRTMSGWRPAREPFETGGELKVNLVENKDNYTLSAEVPGLTDKDIEIEIKDGRLTLRGHVEDAREQTEEHYRIREFRTQSFERVFTVGEGVDAEQVSAKIEHGLLNIVLPKKEEAKPRAIKVEIGS